MTAEATDPTTSGPAAALVGPIMQVGEMAELVADAIAEDNPGVEVHLRDEGSYIHIHTPGRCRLTRTTLTALAGRPIRIGDVEPYMAFFAGHIITTSDEIIWHTKQAAARPTRKEG
ncbi:MmoB/DmpM family protein [Pseudonocardia endophytica]|uniref:Toluene monooxygenase system protein D n=1 Tax=Pseudonocardia endophytica TaxID=401976 RepID=A0A4R1I4T3_PSEEN|nr:MmoB/DmpM family protein [Pseudonocardia endophytica]TCK27599.1 toluene monooxygenase system protein D [Pseudonocardia endophytica]